MARRTQRRTAPSRRLAIWSKRLFLLSFLLGLGAMVYYVVGFASSSQEFRLRIVRLEGLVTLSEAEVLRAAGVEGGDNIIQLDRAALAGRIAAMPRVASAEVSIVFPDTLIVRVVERIPVAALIVRNKAFELDRAGVVLRRYGVGEMPRSPLITEVAGLDAVEIGDTIELPHLDAALRVSEVFAATAMAAEVTLSEISPHSLNEIVMVADELPFELRWGRGDPALQARRLDALWRERGGELGCQEYLDLRFGEDLICK